MVDCIILYLNLGFDLTSLLYSGNRLVLKMQSLIDTTVATNELKGKCQHWDRFKRPFPNG